MVFSYSFIKVGKSINDSETEQIRYIRQYFSHRVVLNLNAFALKQCTIHLYKFTSSQVSKIKEFSKLLLWMNRGVENHSQVRITEPLVLLWIKMVAISTYLCRIKSGPLLSNSLFSCKTGQVLGSSIHPLKRNFNNDVMYTLIFPLNSELQCNSMKVSSINRRLLKSIQIIILFPKEAKSMLHVLFWFGVFFCILKIFINLNNSQVK